MRDETPGGRVDKGLDVGDATVMGNIEKGL